MNNDENITESTQTDEETVSAEQSAQIDEASGNETDAAEKLPTPEELAEQSIKEMKKTKRSTLLNDILDIAESAIFAFFLVIVVFTFVCRVATVEGGSMMQTLQNGDKIFVSHIGYEPEVGDIVVVNCKENRYPPLTSNDYIIKRIIADEGQTVNIDFENGLVYVDGNLLNEVYINNPTTNDEGANEYPFVVPPGCVFVMGDNRQRSTDSRAIGAVRKTDILGHAVFRYWPVDNFGKLE